jgi:CMP/dCMP kinase
MYRAVTLYAMNHKLISEEIFLKEQLIDALDSINLAFKFNAALGFGEIYLNEVNVDTEIRNMKVSRLVSKVAEVPEVRKKLVEQQQQMGINKSVVMDGRDIGTVVFPDAELKIFMTASAEKRAKRRFDEFLDRGEQVTFDETLKNVEYRDHIDTTRKDSPLVKAQDAIEIDNSTLTRKEQFEKVYKLALKIIESN